MTPITTAQLAAKLNSGELLMSPDHADTVATLLREFGNLEGQDGAWYFTSSDKLAEGRPYRVRDGMAVIPVDGMLVHKVDAHIPGYLTGYDYITNLVAEAAEDRGVKGIVLDVSSHGGEVFGAFEASDAVFAAREKKPVMALVDAYAHSAGYALASAANKMVMPQTGSVGSIGVITMHVDYSKALEQNGIKVTMLYKGKHKADGSPYAPLSKEAKANIDARLEESYNVFVATVARNRGVDADAVRNTEAATFSGPKAVELGLADAIMSPKDAMALFSRELSGSQTQGVTMSTQAQPGATAEPSAPQLDASAIATQERERISAITTSEEAKGREDLASHLAFKTGMSAAEAKALLAVSPKKEEAAAPATNAFTAAMSNDNPEIGADTASGEQPEESVVARVARNYALATGTKTQ